MRRFLALIALAAALAIPACDQIPFTVQVPIVLTEVHLAPPDSLDPLGFQKRVVDVTEYSNFAQYIDFAQRIHVDSVFLRITNHQSQPVNLEIRVSEDTTYTAETVDQAEALVSLNLLPDTTQRLSGLEFLNEPTLRTLQDEYLPAGLFALYFRASAESTPLNLTVDSLVLYVRLEGAK